jgi:hypothetical protein
VRGLVRDGSESKLPDGVEPAVGDLNDPETPAAAGGHKLTQIG